MALLNMIMSGIYEASFIVIYKRIKDKSDKYYWLKVSSLSNFQKELI